jgi:dTDP-4-amino-4,6-dideoxygalactose transaminase
MPIFVVNAVPVLVDADPTHGNIDPADIERHITAKTKAIVVTHMWGMPCDMARISEIAQRHGLMLVEDCSHAHGGAKKVGTWGDVAVFSLQAKKLVAAGQGGILVTKHREMYERANLLGHFKVRSLQEVHSEEYKRFAETGFGLNYRMHPLAAAIANVQFARLEDHIQGRRDNFTYLNEKLTGYPGLILPREQPGDRHVYYSYKFSYLAEESGIPIDLFVEALRAEGVDISRSKTLPLHHEAVFQEQYTPMKCYDKHPRPTYSAGDLPNSELYANRALSLTEYTTPARPLLDQYVLAIEKVIENAKALIDYGNRRGVA